MKQFVLLLFCCSLAASNASAASADPDGNWWRTQSDASKQAFVGGIFSGIKVGRNFSLWGFMFEEGESAKEARKRLVASYDDHANLLIKVSTTQVSDGLNAFYTDYRNRSITIQNAFWPVLKIINGSSEEEIERLVGNLRKNAKTE